jgi:hypothetical protein
MNNSFSLMPDIAFLFPPFNYFTKSFLFSRKNSYNCGDCFEIFWKTFRISCLSLLLKTFFISSNCEQETNFCIFSKYTPSNAKPAFLMQFWLVFSSKSTHCVWYFRRQLSQTNLSSSLNANLHSTQSSYSSQLTIYDSWIMSFLSSSIDSIFNVDYMSFSRCFENQLSSLILCSNSANFAMPLFW